MDTPRQWEIVVASIDFTPEHGERIEAAYRALEELMDKYRVDIFHNDEGEWWFDVREYEPPKLKVV